MKRGLIKEGGRQERNDEIGVIDFAYKYMRVCRNVYIAPMSRSNALSKANLRKLFGLNCSTYQQEMVGGTGLTRSFSSLVSARIFLAELAYSAL